MPTPNDAASISGNDQVLPTTISGSAPRPQIAIIIVRYRRGMRVAETANAPMALPIPNPAMMKP